MSAKQDRTGARTAADIERKYNLNWGQSFAEVMGIATDARTKAETVAEEIKTFDENLTADEIFNRLTENGEKQGVFTYENGEVYVNAKYITAISELFSKNITMSGKFTNEVEVFLEPEEEEVETIRQHLEGTNVLSSDLLQLYDSNGDGQVTILDLGEFNMASLGKISLKDRAFAKKTKITMTIDLKNPDKFIEYSGKNMWSRNISGYIGVNKYSGIDRKFKKALYKGSWSGGTITVPNTADYMLFRIDMDGQGTSILATRKGSHIRGVGGYSSATPNVTTYHFAATVDGEDWALVACNSGRPFEDGTLSNMTVTSITGII